MLIHEDNVDHIDKESRTLVQKLRDKRSEVRESLLEMEQELPEEEEDDIPDWKIIADLRAAHNISPDLAGGESSAVSLPSTFVELSHSDTLDYDEEAPVKQFSETCFTSNSPHWNQQMCLESNLMDGQTQVGGSLWARIFNQHVDPAGTTRISVIDQFSIPLTFMQPFRPLSLEVTLKDGRAKLFLTLTLHLKEGLPEEALDDLATIAIKWADFDPLPHSVQQCSYWLAPQGYKLGSQVPFVKCDTRDADSFSRAYFMQKQYAGKSLADQSLVPV